MAAIIDSAPDCVTDVGGAKPADDIADFIVQAPYQDCAGIMTFGPGTTYGDEGAAAATSYYLLTWLGIAVMVAALVYWVIWENRRLLGHTLTLRNHRSEMP
jgi:cytochrome oxidase assembly protein ShyY1